MKRIDPSTLDLKDKVVTINRVSKTVKGGRTMRFSALVVVGDGNGHVGCGMGKAAEIPDAIRKGKEAAMKNIIKVEMNDVDSIYHGVTGEYGSASVLLMPAPEGTGIIAVCVKCKIFMWTFCISKSKCWFTITRIICNIFHNSQHITQIRIIIIGVSA